MSSNHGSEPPQPYYTHDYPPQYDRVQVGNTRYASLVSLVGGLVGLVGMLLTSLEWIGWIAALAAVIAGLIGLQRSAARDKYVSWAGLALGVVALVIGIST
jgi:hypothetical protein